MFRRSSIGFVFQQFNLFPALTAAENVEYALNLKGMRGKGARVESAAHARSRRALRPRGSCRATSLAVRSSGWRSPVPWPGRAPILLADEPTANLDSQVGTQVLELFRDLAKREGRLRAADRDP